MRDSSLCPYRHHNGLIIECYYRPDACVCKRGHCPYFPTLTQARVCYQNNMQEIGDMMADKVAEMKRKIREARKEL